MSSFEIKIEVQVLVLTIWGMSIIAPPDERQPPVLGRRHARVAVPLLLPALSSSPVSMHCATHAEGKSCCDSATCLLQPSRRRGASTDDGCPAVPG
jgi:hypothetical protein